MNDDTDKPLNPVGDAALEARITAWVLGEASPFEAAELEEICARDAGARLFEQRLRVLHGFIVEDRKAGPDDEWKLPAEKRAKIEALFEEPVAEKEEIREQPKMVHHRSHTGRRVLLALAACTVVSVATWSLMDTVVMSRKKSEVAAMRMEAPRATVDFLPGGGAGGGGVVLRGMIEEKENSLAYDVPATPLASAKPMGGAAPPAPALAASEAKSELGQVADESLVQLSERSAAKRREAGPPVKKPVTSYLHLSQNSPMTTKPALAVETRTDMAQPGATPAAPATATDAIALNKASERHAFGLEAAADRDGKPANGAESMERAPLGKSLADVSGLPARSRGEAPASGPVARDGPMEPGMAGGRAMSPSAPHFAGVWLSQGQTPAQSDVDLQAAGNRSGSGTINRNNIDAILNHPDRVSPAQAGARFFSWSDSEGLPQQSDFKDLAKMGEFAGDMGETPEFGMNLRFGSERSDFGNDAAGRRVTGFIQNEGLKELADSKSKAMADGGVSTFDSDGFANVGRPIEGVGEVPMIDGVGGNAISSAKFQSGATGQATMLDLPASPTEEGDEAKRTPVTGDAAKDRGGADGYDSLAQRETIRRQNAVATSDKLRDEGRDAYAKGDYKAAVDKFKASMDVLPDAGMVQDRRDFLSQVLADGSTALGEQYRKIGKYDEARQLADDVLKVDANNEQAKTLKGYLDDPIRTNPALAYDPTQNTEEVRRKLYIAEGNYNLGKFDEANRAYEDVLRVDPYNKAARRGMESVAQARSDYYRAAYDETRAQLLAEVDRAWEVAAPPMPQEARSLTATRNPRESIIIPEIDFEDTSVEEALDFLRVRAAEVDPAKKGVPIVLAKSAEGSGEVDPGKLRIAKLEMKGAKLGDVMTELARTSGLEVAFEGESVVVRPGPKTPTKADVIVDLMAEIATSAEPFSTFSLHVSDASFKMAKAALDRGEVPAADGIRPEEFYNAFDYGDPSPASGEPVVCAVEQSAHPALPQRNLLRIGVKTGSQGRGGSTPLNLTLLLDSSGSMEREDRNAGLAHAVRRLSGLLKEGDTVSVIGFARQPRLLVDRLPGNRAQELNAIFAQTPSEGGTNLEEGIKLGEELAMRQFNPAAQNRIVLFTDGAANLGDAKPETLQAKVEEMRQKGIAFDAAGFGTDGLNDKLLERLTRNGNGRYYIVDRAEDADANFAKQLAGAFRPAAENVKVQVRFNPARVAKYKLIGFEEHRLKKEDFRNDAVDAAEMAAEEAGNALYQIETLPQGEGEVGEVSVRFRDAASGQMVERTWTIPYEAQVPAFDQAAPAIQLAGLAAFAAEKLRSAPLADVVDFQHLAPVMAKVKARYANSKPVAELEAMIGKLK